VKFFSDMEGTENSAVLTLFRDVIYRSRNGFNLMELLELLLELLKSRFEINSYSMCAINKRFENPVSVNVKGMHFNYSKQTKV